MKKIIFLTIILITIQSYAQLDTIHWLPPLHSRTSSNIKDHYIYLSTPDTIPFVVTITDGAGTILDTPIISQGTPYRYYIGSGQGTKEFIEASDLNTALTDKGLIMTAKHKFYANMRVRSNVQAGSLTCKGNAAKGTLFRAGVVPNNINNNFSQRNFCISIMATQNNTTVMITDYDTDVEFYDVSGNITLDTVVFLLDSGQSYVISGYNDIVANRQGFVGALIQSDKPIVLNNGNLIGSIASASGQDIMIDQAVPYSKIGDEYILIRGNGTDEMERPLVIATQDNTDIYVNGGSIPIATINAGEWFLIPESYYTGNNNKNMYVKTSKNIYMYQPLGGTDDAVTPGLNFIPSLSCFYTKKVDLIPDVDSIGTTHYSGAIFAYTLSGSIVTVNGTIQSGSESVDGNPQWETYKLTGLSGDAILESTGPMAVGFFGYNGAAGFAGFYSGFSVEKEKQIVHRSNEFAKYCMGFTFSLNDTSYVSDIFWTISNLDSVSVILDSATSYEFSYLFPDSGYYIISCAIRLNCYNDTIIDTMCVAPLTYQINKQDEHCNMSDGRIQIELNSGVTPINYTWSTSDSLPYIDSLSAGGYSLTITDFNGCSIKDSVTINIIEENINIETQDSILCEGDSTILIADEGFDSYYWLPIGDTTQTIIVSNTGFYKVEAVNSVGCTATDSIYIQVLDAPYVYAGEDDTICNNEQIILSASNPQNATIQWSNGIENGVPFTPSLGSNTYIVTATLGDCYAIDSINIMVIPLPEFTTTYSDFCSGTESVLYVNGYFDSYQWIYNGNIISTNQNVNVSQQGIYYIAVTQNECTSIDSVEINEIPATLANINNVYDNLACYNDSNGRFTVELFYQSVNYDIFVYKYLDTLYFQHNLNISYNLLMDSLTAGTYYVKIINDNGCESTDSIKITQPTAFQVNANIYDVKCFGNNNGVIEISISGGTPEYNILWSNNDTSDYIYNLSPGKYEVTINDANNCTYTTGFTVKEPEELIILDSIYYGYNNLGNINIHVQGGVEPYNYLWSNGVVTNINNNLNPGVYSVTVTDNNMCKDTASFIIKHIDTEVIIPSVFTPNNDGINDTWEIKGIENYKDINIKVYNRWGDELYAYSGSGFGYMQKSIQWNGKWKGKDLPFGTYLYIIKLNQTQKLSGTVTIVR